MQGQGKANRLGSRRENAQTAVAVIFQYVAIEPGSMVFQHLPVPLHHSQRPGLILLHKPGISGDIGEHDGCQAAALSHLIPD